MKRASPNNASAVAHGESGANQKNGDRSIHVAGGVSSELTAILASLQTMRDGDFSVRLPGSWTGLPGKIADTFNEIVAANQQISRELMRVGQVIGKEGRTRERTRFHQSKGAWGEMEVSVNTLHDPDFKIIILTITDSDQVIREALEAGARGFVLKSDAARDLVSAVEALQSKRMFFTPRVNDLVLAGFLEKGHPISRSERPNLPTLTAREREVTQLLAEGKSSKEAACLLNLSTKTVETHRSNIMRKLSLHSIRDLVVYAIKNNIIQIDMPLEIKGSPQRNNPQVA